MDNDGKKETQTEEEALLTRLREAKRLYVLMSPLTKAPYVVCDPETFDDQVLVFFRQEDGEDEVKQFARKGIPVAMMEVESRQLLYFYTGLYTMGVNALLVKEGKKKRLLQLRDFVRRREPKPEPGEKTWVENPSLHLTSLYYAQEARRKPELEAEGGFMELREEIETHFREGSFILAIQKEGKGIPLVKLKDGQVYQAAFTDILEFRKFDREDQLQPVIVPADGISQALAKGADGIVLNPMGVNLPLAVNRGEAVKSD